MNTTHESKDTMTTAPLQITKDLLKPWSPCADGYRWFLDKFPQGAEYTAVQKALREDKRFEDARWLTNHVWVNLIMENPTTTADVTADHKAEALEIITATTALNVDTNVPTAELLASGYAAQIGSSGYAAQIGSSGNDARIGSSGNVAQIGSSGYAAQIGSSGNDARIGSSGYAARIGSSGNDARIGSSGNAARIGSSGNDARIGSSGNDARIGSSGYAARIGSSGYAARINASGDGAVIACAGQNSKARAGANGVMALPWFDEVASRARIAVGYVGEDLKADTWYEVKSGKFVEVSK